MLHIVSTHLGAKIKVKTLHRKGNVSAHTAIRTRALECFVLIKYSRLKTQKHDYLFSIVQEYSIF